MSKPNEISFKDITNDEFCDLINKLVPIDLRNNSDLIDRVSAKYKMVDKTEIAIVILAFFKALRSSLCLNKTITIANLFSNCRIAVQNKFAQVAVKIYLSTADSIRKI